MSFNLLHFSLRNVLYIFCDLRVSNLCWAFLCLLWVVLKLPSVITLLYCIINVYDSW
jgi:hypothetical protein